MKSFVCWNSNRDCLSLSALTSFMLSFLFRIRITALCCLPKSPTGKKDASAYYTITIFVSSKNRLNPWLGREVLGARAGGGCSAGGCCAVVGAQALRSTEAHTSLPLCRSLSTLEVHTSASVIFFTTQRLSNSLTEGSIVIQWIFLCQQRDSKAPRE